MIVLAWIIIAIGCAIACGILASNKGRSIFGHALLGFFFALIGVLITACLAPLEGSPDALGYRRRRQRTWRQHQDMVRKEIKRRDEKYRGMSQDEHRKLWEKADSDQRRGLQADPEMDSGGGSTWNLYQIFPWLKGQPIWWWLIGVAAILYFLSRWA